MTRFYGSNASLGQGEPKQRVDSRDQNGRVMVMRDEYTFPAEIAANDDIIFGRKLPAGAKVIDAILDSPAIAGLTDMDLGWLDNGVDGVDLDGFLDGIDISSAKRQHMDDAQGRPGQYKQFSEETEVVLTANAGPSTTATGKKVQVEIRYVMN